MIELRSAGLSALVDDKCGADVVALTLQPTGTPVLLATPWADRAMEIRRGERPLVSSDPVPAWVERYPGGWQVMAPNAGAAAAHGGAPLVYHGESGVVPWNIVDHTADRVTLSTELWTAPLTVERTVQLRGQRIEISDAFTNVSDGAHAFDVLHHPALASALTLPGAHLETGAGTFVNDSDHGWAQLPASSRQPWPLAQSGGGAVHDLSLLPEPGEPRFLFGWLTDFTDHWSRFTSYAENVTVLLEWDGTYLPHAWLWQEFGASAGWPWFGRGRTMAVEPSSTPTSGPLAVPGIVAQPGERIVVEVAMTVTALH